MKQPDPRTLMEKAIEVMRQSIAEPRTDGKASPKVGAVLLKPDGSIDTAFRGELRYGDHAEFTLLERKNRDSKLDGSILFATLEPCAPNARKAPKLGCAERIVLARLKEVWVGIEDPDPTVDRKGIKFLQESGVTVRMFDRDLQEIIQAENRDFIDQAMERAARASEKKVPEVTLSPLEQPRQFDAFEDLSPKALEAYCTIAKIADGVGSPLFRSRLARLGLVQEPAFKPTGYGLLLFGKEPRAGMPQAGLLGTIHHANGQEETRDFDGPQVLVPEQVLEWLRDKLPNLIDRSGARRTPVNAALFELVREGVVNALVHRDYSIEGAKCQLIVTPDTIEIRSPGRPVDPITLEQIQSFSAPMLSRNPVLHYVFAQMELAEERGLGLKSMKDRAAQAGLPLPRYSWQDPYLVLTLFQTPSSVTSTLDPAVLANLKPDERAGWEFAAGRDNFASADLMKQLGFDEKKAQRILKKLIQLKLLRRLGKGPATRYQLSSSPA